MKYFTRLIIQTKLFEDIKVQDLNLNISIFFNYLKQGMTGKLKLLDLLVDLNMKADRENIILFQSDVGELNEQLQVNDNPGHDEVFTECYSFLSGLMGKWYVVLQQS